MRSLMTGGLLALMLATGTGAQELEFGAQIRPRFEFRSADWFDTDAATEFTSMRTRLWLGAALPRDLTAFVQLQDVRVWGEEVSTTDPSAEGLDMHQAWLELGDPAGGAAARIGRQELAYGEERLVGALDWVQQARAFDGARLRGRRGDVVVDAFAMRLREDEVFPEDASFYGIYGTLQEAIPTGPLDVYLLFDTQGDDITEQLTLGGRLLGETAPVSWRVEAAYQTGTRATQDVSAYLVALRAGIPFADGGRAELWYDRLSGDDDPLDGEIKVFDTLFATNHKFYGLMDLFTNIPAHTGGRGLQDLAVKATLPRDDVLFGADLHAFLLTATDGLDSGHLGEELDLTARWAYAPGVSFTGGLAFFAPGDAWPTEDVQSWVFVMADVVF